MECYMIIMDSLYVYRTIFLLMEYYFEKMKTFKVLILFSFYFNKIYQNISFKKNDFFLS